ncbi:MAG: type II 3-dehydroquinate dehydratase [Caldithrix sp.]|nr:type II 3-dehydroquinate dehydratase [Caldithrix sp.]
MKILVINGPNLNMLGTRKPGIYGHSSLNEVKQYVADYFKRVKLDFYQSNHEGEIVDKIQQADQDADGLVINPGAYGHYSYAIRDAIEAVQIPVIEVHISNLAARETFRHVSVISSVCQGTLSGMGIYGYVLGVQALAHQLKKKDNEKH